MTTRRDDLRITVEGQILAATLAMPAAQVPGVLFVHGWGGSQERDIERARGIAALGCVCLTFDMRGHAATSMLRDSVNREQNLADVLAAYDLLVSHRDVDPPNVAVVGSSYGGYLAAILTELRPVRWLALRVPALYRDEEWDAPKQLLDREVLATYRRRPVPSSENRALRACSKFSGDVLLVESEHDDLVPRQTILSYRAAFSHVHSLTYRVIDGADHALSGEADQRAFGTTLLNWTTEMILGARVGESSPGRASV